MKNILIDSGPLIALFDASDKHHVSATNFIKNNKSILITTIASVTETLHLLDFNRNAQIDFLDWVNKGAVEIQNQESLLFVTGNFSLKTASVHPYVKAPVGQY